MQFPVLKIDGSNNGSNLPLPLHRTVVSFEKSILECHFLCEKSGPILRDLEEKTSALTVFHDQLDQLIEAQGLLFFLSTRHSSSSSLHLFDLRVDHLFSVPLATFRSQRQAENPRLRRLRMEHDSHYQPD